MATQTGIRHCIKLNDPGRYLVESITAPGVNISKTTLYAIKSTRGHSHSHPELYYFVSGEGSIIIGRQSREVFPGSTAFIPGNAFHRVVNHSRQNMVFLCLW